MPSSLLQVFSTRDLIRAKSDILALRVAEHVVLADFKCQIAASHSKERASQDFYITSKIEQWRQLLVAFQTDQDTASFDSIAIHSSALYFIIRALCDHPASFSDWRPIEVLDVIISEVPEEAGILEATNWPALFDVKRSVTVRGCKHVFSGAESLYFLSGFDSSDPGDFELSLIGGQDMDIEATEQCVSNVAFVQYQRDLQGRRPFSCIEMRFPLHEEEIQLSHETWDRLPELYRGNAQLQISEAPYMEYKGTEQEEALYTHHLCLDGYTYMSFGEMPSSLDRCDADVWYGSPNGCGHLEGWKSDDGASAAVSLDTFVFPPRNV